MVDVVRGNFSSLLPRVEECIRRCDFVGEEQKRFLYYAMNLGVGIYNPL